jgi:DHA1 family multidrug resistance protein-like MFS transporter
MYMGLSPTLIGILITVNVVLLALLLPYLGKIADRFNRRILVILGSTISFVFLALVPLTHSFWQLLGLCILGAFGGAISIAASSALTVDEGRKFGMGSTMAMFSMAMSLGWVIGPLLSGVVADFANINSVFYFAAAVGLAGTSLFTWFTR